jgi:hypothetical protein
MNSIFLVLFTITLCCAGEWPQYLGPNRNGISAERGFNTNWSQQTPKVLWRQSLGSGFGGAAVSQAKVYVLDRINDERDVFRCFDIHSGQELWQYTYEDPGKFSINGSRAAPTIHGDRAFCVGAMGTVHCFDLIGRKPVWSRDFREDFDAELPTWCPSEKLYPDEYATQNRRSSGFANPYQWHRMDQQDLLRTTGWRIGRQL